MFILCLSLPLFAIAKGGGKILMKGAKELGLVILASAGAMIIGAIYLPIKSISL